MSFIAETNATYSGRAFSKPSDEHHLPFKGKVRCLRVSELPRCANSTQLKNTNLWSTLLHCKVFSVVLTISKILELEVIGKGINTFYPMKYISLSHLVQNWSKISKFYVHHLISSYGTRRLITYVEVVRTCTYPEEFKSNFNIYNLFLKLSYNLIFSSDINPVLQNGKRISN
jgi:hypothetical protein